MLKTDYKDDLFEGERKYKMTTGYGREGYIKGCDHVHPERYELRSTGYE